MCKKKHRHKHKKQCERRVAELHDEVLFKQPPPPEPNLFPTFTNIGYGRIFIQNMLWEIYLQWLYLRDGLRTGERQKDRRINFMSIL